MTVALIMSHLGNMPGLKNTVDLDDVQSLTSYPQSSLASNASGVFPFSHTEPSTDLLNGSSWVSHCEGPQNFQDFADNGSCHSGDAEDYFFASGQTTPKGSRTDTRQATEAAWAATRTVSSASNSAQGMSRVGSNSTFSMSGSPHLSNIDGAGNLSAFRNGSQPSGTIAGMDSCLLLDADAGNVPQVYWPDYNLGLNMNVEGSSAFSLGETGPLHVVPAQMHLGTASGLPDASSPCSWGGFDSTMSRSSSPTTNDETWLSGSMSPHSSPDMKCASPSAERKLSIMSEDQNELAPAHLEESLGLSQGFGPPRPGPDSESARDHALYRNAAPHKDGLFHCPWEPTCSHKPEKLKCNYDKFVDSHLKPYRCKVKTCQASRFSSTACLLRHEREAHGLHGHGEKPFLCTHVGCERSVLGHGFPRQWNLRDHMKRVHNDHSTTSGGSPPAVSAGQAAKGRKRKPDVPEQQTCASRKATVKALPVAEPAQAASRPLLDKWMDHRRAAETVIRGLNHPEDSRTLQQITEAQKHLTAMTKMMADRSHSKGEGLFGPSRRTHVLHKIKEED